MHRSIHRKKLESLFVNYADNASDVFPQVNQNAVLNLSSKHLTSDQLNALKLNNNFASGSKPSFPKLVAPIEKAFRFSALTASQKDSIRHIIANTVDFNSKWTSNTFSKHANSSIKVLCSDPDLVVTKADKGGQIVILDKSSYLDKCNELIAVGPYVTLHKDPSIREINLIKNVVKSSPIISESSKRSLTPSVAHCARFYALPKVHKPDIPLRPIVSNIGTASYKLAKYLVSIFSSLLISNSFTVRNSVHFVQKLRYFKPHGLTMASFDVKSLFTNVPVIGALDCLKLRLQEHHFSSFEIEELVSLTRVCLEQNTFVFNGTYFRMSEGLAMGNPLSPILSYIYMHYFETKLFETITFPFYVRYVDDCFVLLDQNHVDNEFLLSTLNSIDPCIQFTIEMETDSSLSFLDVFITKSNDEFMTSVFRKPFAVTLPPHKCFSSSKPKVGLIQGFCVPCFEHLFFLQFFKC
ncbi:LOW QUALITY PROTEIN: uncharacterized protein LOC129232538 [Uloborus diversus]|uniref:LOW QUALITY PROTEIN: uncharacterized protein LOC129232538 n=1 Tax=Uloborus diversus TaxID=327109 RepID=UPI00240A7357|nr:LOW QUALITY PROTEIN: uncharacterized protein LOC129232538 [Uloborus diversus]